MRIFFLFVLLMFGIRHANAQNEVRFSGVVSDSTDAPLELANVMAIDQATDDVASYGVTDHLGRFVLKLTAGRVYTLKTTYIGYSPYEIIITAKNNEREPFKIFLTQSETRLHEVTIEEEFPVVISGDTITYKADAFVKGNERKLEDVLKAIPGFEVDENGEVKVQGKTVEKVLVEGKEFFEGDTKMATQNIPANAVDKVQVLRNFNDISPMRNLDDGSDRLAINIKLDEDKKNLLFGDLEAGLGPKNRYFGHTNLFYYSPKGTLNLIADGNNIGREAFTARDYFRFMGGLNGLSRRSGSSLNITEDNLGFLGQQSQNSRNIDTKLGAVNFNYVPNKQWNFSGFIIGSSSDNITKSLSNRTYVNSDENNQEMLSTDNNRNSLSTLAKFKSSFTPNDNLHIGFELFAKGSELKTNTDRLSNNLGFDNFINSHSVQNPISVNQQLSLYAATSENNIFSFETTYNYQVQDPFLDINSSGQLFEGILPLEGNDQYTFLQNKEIKTHQQEAQGNWYHILNKTNHINISIGNVYSRQYMNSRLDQIDNLTLLNDLYRNDIKYTFSDLYSGLSYKTKIGKFTISPGLNLHRYKISTEQNIEKKAFEKTLLLPELWANFEILSSQNIRFQYSRQASFADVQKMASGLVVQNYNNLYQGNREVQNAIFHDFRLNYSNFSLFSNLNLYAGVNYQKKLQDITDAVSYQNLERITNPINIGSPNEMANFYGDITKTFRTFKLNGSANLYYASIGNTINGFENRNKSFTQQFDFSGETTLFKTLIVAVGYERTFNEYQSNTTSNDFYNDKPYFEVEWSFLNLFTVTTDYTFNHYQSVDGAVDSKYDFLNATFMLNRVNSPWTFQVSGLNLLQTNAIRRDSFSESQVSTLAYFVQPRYFMFSLKYEI